MAEQIYVPKFRVSFPSLEEARAYQQQAPQFSVVALWPKEGTDFSNLKRICKEALVERFDLDPNQPIPSHFKVPFRDGSEKSEMDGYGSEIIFARMSTGKDYPPRVVDRSGQPVIEANEIRRLIYAGCWCDAIASAFAFDNVSKGVKLNLVAIRKVDDGEAFGGSTPDMDKFEKLPPAASGGGAAAPGATSGDDFLG